MNLSQLKIGQRATIESFTDSDMSLKLLEMGCIPGEEVELKLIAPLGCPIAISVSGYILSMRKSEASSVIVSII